jgi:hypothetical protein
MSGGVSTQTDTHLNLAQRTGMISATFDAPEKGYATLMMSMQGRTTGQSTNRTSAIVC